MRPEIESRWLDWLSGKEFVCQCRRYRRCRFHHWFEKFLEKGMATHSSILAWKVPWAEEPSSYSSWGCKESDTTEYTRIQPYFKALTFNHYSICKIIYRISFSL